MRPAAYSRAALFLVFFAGDSMQLSKFTNLSHCFITSAASTDVIVHQVDTANYEGARCFSWNSTGAVVITVAHAASTTAAFVSVGSSVTYQTSAAGFLCCVDIHKPVKRWLQFTCTATGNTDFGAFVERYGARLLPTTWTSTVGLPTTGGGVRCAVSPSSTA